VLKKKFERKSSRPTKALLALKTKPDCSSNRPTSTLLALKTKATMLSFQKAISAKVGLPPRRQVSTLRLRHVPRQRSKFDVRSRFVLLDAKLRQIKLQSAALCP
jgi:hypothetical protein